MIITCLQYKYKQKKIKICRLGRLAENTDGAPNAKKTPAELKQDLEQNKAKRRIINDLQSKNRYVCFGFAVVAVPFLATCKYCRKSCQIW